MSQPSRPLKRPRDVSEDSGPSSSHSFPIDALKRSEEFWVPDGNIVLVAGCTAFRVYRGLLALQSPVFADLFAASSPTADESYDDCPLIRITESPEDLVHLLRLLLPGSRVFLQRRKGDAPFSLHQISALIRLSHKYQIDDLLRQALYILLDFFPTTFKKWEASSSESALVDDIEDGSPIAVVNLARLTDTLSLLPILFYECCSIGPAVVDGWKREDGTVEYLSPADLKRCIHARNIFAKEAFTLVSTIFDPKPSNECSTPTACVAALRSTFASAMRHPMVADSTVLDPWLAIIHKRAYPQYDSGYCSACEHELVTRDLTERERIWNRLPEIFDVEIPNWTEDPDGES